MNIGMRIKLVPGEVSEGLEKDLKRVDQLWTEGLERFGGPWLAGTEFGAVDAFYAPVVLRLQVCFFLLLGWIGRLCAAGSSRYTNKDCVYMVRGGLGYCSTCNLRGGACG